MAKLFGQIRDCDVKTNRQGQLTSQFLNNISKKLIVCTHDQVAKLAGVARTNVTGIISGSVTSVTLDRLVRIAAALGLSMDLEIKKSA